MTVRWFAWSLLSPSQVLFASLFAGLLLLAFRRDRWGRRLAYFGGGGLLLFGLLPTTLLIANVLETRFPRPSLPSRIDGIVLLSGSERPAASQAYGEPQVGISGGRYLTTLRLAHRYPDARVVFTGDKLFEAGKGLLGTQSAVGAQIFEGVGVDARRITFEDASRDTCDNAFHTYALVKPRPGERWVVVTSALHIPRTVACLRAAGWNEAIPQPADYRSVLAVPNTGAFRVASNLQLLDDASHEWIGLLFYRVTGRTRELFPAP